MWQWLAIYGVLALAAFVLYFVTGRSRSARGGFAAWLRQGWSRTSSNLASRPAAPTVKVDDPDEDEALDVAMVLEDLYTEFVDESRRLREDTGQAIDELSARFQGQMDELRAQVLALQQKVARLETGFIPAGPQDIQPAHASGTGESNLELVPKTTLSMPAAIERRQPSVPGKLSERPLQDRYFLILDALQLGEAPDHIARRLGVAYDEIELVLRVMGPAVPGPTQ